MKILATAFFIVTLQGCALAGSIFDTKLESEADRRYYQNASLQEKQEYDAASLSRLGGEIDMAILEYAVTGKKPAGKSKPQSCNELKGKDKQHCVDRVESINKHISKHANKQ